MSNRISEMLRRLAPTRGGSAPGGAGAASGAESPGAADVEAMLRSDAVPQPPLAARMRGRQRLLSMATQPTTHNERRNPMTVFGFKLVPPVAGAIAALVLVGGMAGAAAVTPLPGPQDAVTAAFDDDEEVHDGASLEACEDDDEVDDVDDVDDIDDDADDEVDDVDDVDDDADDDLEDIEDDEDDCDEIDDVEETPVAEDTPTAILPAPTQDAGLPPAVDDDIEDDDLDEPEDIEDEDDDLDDLDDGIDDDDLDDDGEDIDDDGEDIDDDIDDDGADLEDDDGDDIDDDEDERDDGEHDDDDGGDSDDDDETDGEEDDD